MTESYYDSTRIPKTAGQVDENALEPSSQRYEILGEPLRGGMGPVYPANDTSLSRKIAIKRIRPEFIRDQDFLIRFRKEANAMAALDHPNLVSVFDLMEDEHGPIVSRFAWRLVEQPRVRLSFRLSWQRRSVRPRQHRRFPCVV